MNTQFAHSTRLAPTQAKSTLHTLKLPLVLAMSSCLLVACSSTKEPVARVGTPTNAPKNTSSVATSKPATSGVSSALLDEETLSILEDLLEARDMTMVEGDRLSVERYGNLWDRVRRGYRMAQPNWNSRIEAQKDWFSNRQSYLDRLTARASRYLHHTVTEAERRGLPTELALLPIIESSYDPSATSNAAAAGLWQFIPSTGRIYGLNQSRDYDGRRDVIESTRAAYDFLSSLYNQFGSWELALAAYNAGPGRIQRAINANAAQGLPTDYWSLRLPTETMNYVPRFMAVAQIIGNPSAHGVSLPAIANHTHFRTVPVNYGVSLYDVSNVTGVSVDELRLLNPALTNLRVDSAGPNRVVIPTSVSNNVDSQLRNLGVFGSSMSAATTPTQTTSYISTAGSTSNNSAPTQTLSSANTLPTTTAHLTAHNTITQEPPLSQEERSFIAEQIRLNTPEVVQPINPVDGNIQLDALQTAQSVLDARGQTKSLQYADDDKTTTSNTTMPSQPSSASNTPAVTAPMEAGKPTNAATSTPKETTTPAPKPERYTVKAGDTLTGVAAVHGLTVSQLASYNNLETNAQLLRGQKLWLVSGKVTAKPAPSSTSTVSAQPKASNIKTSTYKVKSGETLIGIAAKLGMSANELVALNDFDANARLQAGQSIKVPANLSDKLSGSASSAAQSSATTQYTVQAGDTLTGVAARHGISVRELAAANNMSENATLIRGKRISIPKAGAATNTSTSKAAASGSTNTAASGKTIAQTENYTVKAGDNLSKLATRYGVSVNDLAKTNNLAANATLRTGQTIKVPKLTTTHTVKSGESLNSVAKRYGISVSELANMNNLKSSDGLKVGQKLTVPNK